MCWLRGLLCCTLAALAIASLFLGRYPEPGFLSLQRLVSDEFARNLVLNLRLPRIITAVLLGVSLSAAGTVFQMIFSNPLVEPGFLGVTQGAAFGAALCIVCFGNSSVLVQVFALVFAVLGLFLSYLLGRKVRFGGWILRLILAGIAVAALYSAGLGVLKFIADPMSQLQEITFWLLGGLWSITFQSLYSILVPVLASIAVMYRMRWRLNLLSLSDITSFSLGVAPGRERTLALSFATLAVASMVSVCGTVSWVGLIIPQAARRMFGADTRHTLPGSMLLGGIFVLLCDDLARVILPGEIPLGVVTSLLGASIFMFLMTTQNVRVLHKHE